MGLWLILHLIFSFGIELSKEEFKEIKASHSILTAVHLIRAVVTVGHEVTHCIVAHTLAIVALEACAGGWGKGRERDRERG